ncbi:rod shape-determining protein MreC [Streptococcaceae bacterium ESL0729]|nr:rod shape-determining protein MreC [Streptococcaceae bacterium ESL0729]
MKKLNISKLIIISLLIVIIAMGSIIISAKNYKSNVRPSQMTQVVNDTTGEFDMLLSSPGKFLRDQYVRLQSFLATYEENQALKKENYSLNSKVAENDSLMAENKALREALDLKTSLVGYQEKTANVINRNPSSWNDTLIVNVGEVDGIKENMVVMADKAVIGRVSQVNNTSSKVSLLISKQGLENKIPVRIGSENQASYGLISSYDDSKKAYIMSQVTGNNEIKDGDLVVTSGLGGDSPQDLPIGKVAGKRSSSDGLSQEIYVEPLTDFYDIRVVNIVERNKEAD